MVSVDGGDSKQVLDTATELLVPLSVGDVKTLDLTDAATSTISTLRPVILSISKSSI